MDSVAEDEPTSSPAYPGVGVAFTRSVVHGSPAVSLYMGAIDGDHTSDQGSRLMSYLGEPVEDVQVCLLAELVPELSEEAVASLISGDE